jgi:membrane protein DedA with SNARE-associated domain/DNA-directed RNA polymerase specialized sigma24 family protein
MNAIVQFVIKHGYSVLFAAMFAHQLGLPVPGPLFLLAAGALAAAGKLGLVPALGLSVTACVLADWVWYEGGRRRGDKVLHFIHRFTRDPDAHDRRAKETFARYGTPILVVAKFVPGLDAVAPPLAGTSGTSRLRFLAFDAVGASLYSVAYAGLGYVFRNDLDRAAAYAGRAGTLLAGLAFAGLFIYAARKLVLRYRSIRECRFARMTTMLKEIRGNHRCAKADDIREVFGDYHNVLRWLTVFLNGDDKLADAFIVDACSIAQTQTPDFHEWLVHWAARATVGCALQVQHVGIVELAPEYEKSEPVHGEHPPLSAEYFRLLIEKSEVIYARLDVLCRFVLVMRGIAKYSCVEVATQLGVSPGAVERAYCIAFDTLALASSEVLCNADVPPCHLNDKPTLAGSTA